MSEPTELEIAVIRATSDQLDSEDREYLLAQFSRAIVTERKNSGAGFFTYFAIERRPNQKIKADLKRCYVGAEVKGLDGELGFIPWTRDGYLDCLEGYTLGTGNTVGIDLTQLTFEIVDHRTKFLS